VLQVPIRTPLRSHGLVGSLYMLPLLGMLLWLAGSALRLLLSCLYCCHACRCLASVAAMLAAVLPSLSMSPLLARCIGSQGVHRAL